MVMKNGLEQEEGLSPRHGLKEEGKWKAYEI
jgi:hypothetical protein